MTVSVRTDSFSPSSDAIRDAEAWVKPTRSGTSTEPGSATTTTSTG